MHWTSNTKFDADHSDSVQYRVRGVSSEGSNMEGQVKLYETMAVIDMGDVDVMFYKPTEIGRDEITIEILGVGKTIDVTINSKTLLGMLKALETGHDRRKAHEEGRKRWQNSMR